MKLACVVQRYGPGIAGGSEAHCRHLAERLAAQHDVHVLTSCAADYVHWHNTLEPGWSTVGPVRVQRFPVARQRRLHTFADLSERAFARRHTVEDEQAWFHANGPEVPELVEYLQAHGHEYDLVLFWAFRYYQSIFGLPVVQDRAVLVPTAEEDAVLDFVSLRDYFQRPRGYIFLTEEERQLVTTRAGRLDVPSTVIGTGLDVAGTAPASVLEPLGIDGPFVVYLGRVDRNKGCDRLVDHFIRYQNDESRDVTLVLAGPVHVALQDHPRVRVLGFVSDDVREALFANALALVMPSPYESLCIALLEAWNHGLPALVNARCSVLEGQVRRAGGGLHYGTYREFAAGLSWLLDHPAGARQFGQQGLAYVEREYRWPMVMSRVETLLEEVRARVRTA
ncbi:MAG: glycosyltransferase family 4 protein [Acidobacteria bacterium]|nr:glycosyltransferase family 4 protein [Acidobacteriota bacterium]